MNLLLLGAMAGLLQAQPLDSSALTGQYHYRYLRVTQMDAGGRLAVTEHAGSVTFDGRGGNYTVDERGAVTMASPGEPSLALSARLSTEAGVIAGSSIETTGVYDLYVAIKASAPRVAPSGRYLAAAILFPNSQASAARSATASFDAAEAGLRLAADGTGTMMLPLTTGLPTRGYNVTVSADGGLLIGSPNTGAKGLLIAVRGSSASPAGLYWTAAIGVEPPRVNAALGSMRTDRRGGALINQRWSTAGGIRQYKGSRNLAPFAVGPNASLLLAANAASAAGSLTFAIRAPETTGSGIFVDPNGIEGPVAPGALVSLTGSGLAPRPAAAASLPLPVTLEGVAVEVNSRQAGIHSVSPGEIRVVLPADLEGDRARFVVRRGNESSRPVIVPLAAASPGILLGTHLDYGAITPSSPARPGELIILFATGLGVRQPYLRVRIGGLPAAVFYSGSAGVPGLDQINVRVPARVAAGAAVPVSVSGGGAFVDSAEVAVEH
ncbi:MAG: hypothetical protein SFV51_15180 [Bryobacteraceae bacterium]|nr:hypothetical protein [Bryobacteraceae bacterium]